MSKTEAYDIIYLFIEIISYYKSTYRRLTNSSFFSVKLDTGKYGEYLTYKKLKDFENRGAKFLFNLYIPKEDGQTTEIDVVMLCSSGIFVFESKNYSGWIFGNENQKNWCQTLPKGRGNSNKELFYNPILQNKSHIKHLQNLIGNDISIWSVIVFSERCTLKDIQVNNDAIKVIRRCDAFDTVENICKNAPEDINQEIIEKLYNTLYPYTQVSDEVRKKHIDDIKSTENKETYIKVTEQNDTKKCPKCESDLVLRTASKGNLAGKKFWGCSKYPRCKYVLNITDTKDK